MAIVAQLQESEASAETPRHPRLTLRLETRGAMESGSSEGVLVHNISQTGLLLESSLGLAVDERIAIDLPQVGEVWARIVWKSGDLHGCEFKNPLPPSALSAAQLRSAVTQRVKLDEREEAVTALSFGELLQQLRAERRLSQSEVAARMGVSKPTVWAWEHGKARPLDDRLDALAEVLGVARTELAGTGPARERGLDALVARHREQIAAAVGTRPENVRITIDL